MNMFSEINSEQTAKRLEKIILSAMKGGQWGSIRSAVRGFAKEELVEWYYEECGETWGSYEVNPEILKAFPPKKDKKED